jgi:glucose/arabinose dehydrogenase
MPSSSRHVKHAILLSGLVAAAGLACLATNGRAAADDRAAQLAKLSLPAGFHIEVYAADVPNARQMALSPGGTLFVGTREDGRVFAVVDRNHDQKADEVITIARGLAMPSGVAFKDGALYVGEIGRITRYDGIEGRLANPPAPVVVNGSYPNDRHHGWKFIAFGPDGWLYVPVGAPCNVCERPDNPRYASITRMKPDGSAVEIVAKGVRNSVGFDWNPANGQLWFTDNGRDELGDDVPHCELNHATAPGQHFGFPYCHAGTVADPEFGRKRACREFMPPAQGLGAHVAPLGMRFYTGQMFPAAYRNRIFIAEHGSWNRSKKVGYRVVTVTLDGDRVVAHEPFATGWLQGEEEWGRPVDVLVMPDGALLVSDDRAGAIYRITYKT